MIDVKTRIHDRYSLEFKVGFSTGNNTGTEDFQIGMWIFVPESLDINPATYSKTDFYRDLKSNVRLITPEFALSQIAGEGCIPLANVLNASPDELEQHIKMYTAIAKSAVRDEAAMVVSGKESVIDFSENVRAVVAGYDKMPSCEGLDLCREFLFTTIIHHSFKILQAVPESPGITALIKDMNAARIRLGYETINQANPDEAYLYRQGVLKKYVEHHLYLRAPKKRDAILAEQAYYSVAAGLAMIFATLVAWAFQRTFGNLTWPLFIALIISYMMKDRIKELMRYWFAHKARARYFDNKATISYNDRKLGSLKEAFDFINSAKVPEEIWAERNGKRRFGPSMRVAQEKVMLYRKKVTIDCKSLSEGRTYEYNGVNDIIRLNTGSLLRMMDNSSAKVEVIDPSGKVTTIDCPKVYHVNIVLQCVQNGNTEYQHFRLYLTSDGIRNIEKV